MFWTWKLAIFCLCLCQRTIGQFEEEPYSCSADNATYDFEKKNYYEILGFSGSARTNAGLDSKSIRKAYRRQAQSWHPDKLRPNATLPIEEINARFAHISLAYETLSDQNKRQAYDRFLENCEYMQGQQRPPDNQYNSPYENPYYSQQQKQHHQSYHYHNNYQNHDPPVHKHPSSIQKERDMLVDPMTGAPILRETTYEEYANDNYYRILVEDFLVESMDAWGNSYYQPLYPYPRVVEEGPLQHEPEQKHEQQHSTDTMEEGDVLRTEAMLLSKNERYRAHVDNCRLVIQARRFSSGSAMEDDQGFDLEIETIWESDNEAPFFGMMGQQSECFLALDDGQLLLAGGSPESYTGDIVWFSGDRHHDDEGESFMFSRHTYRAVLENDGKLVVYRLSAMDISEEPTCVYATGPLGCVRAVSKIRHSLRVARERFGPLQKLLEFGGDAEAESGDEAFQNYQKGEGMFDEDGEDSIITFLFGAAKRAVHDLNRARKGIEESLEQKTIQWVHSSIQRWQKYRGSH